MIATLGSKGAICLKDGHWTAQSVFPVDVKDTVGAGDAFLASFVTYYLQSYEITECLRFACAVGALTASKHGGTPLIMEEEITSILKTTL